MVRNGGQLLLILTSTDAQTATALTAASGLTPAETVRQLHRLVAQGFLVVSDATGDLAVYQLNPKGVRSEEGTPHQRILLIEDDVAVQELMTLVLEDQGYAVVVSRTPAEAGTLLAAVAFDLVITDGFSETPTAVVGNTAAILTAAGATPVALFTAHHLELDAARAAGFRDLLEKPFDLDLLEQQVRVLLTP